ncbi:hypothetical protein COCON_G00037180 [Conger conger]|uniref:Uncharacterized protein n=1 Tax=Conger conger TaxID=82655 RepID=A0A9Q1DZV7_CONCO|nr:hypothetical protein COCON_G00037180 [Conger conger]
MLNRACKVGTWRTQPYLGIPLMSHLQDRGAIPPQHLLEWFLGATFQGTHTVIHSTQHTTKHGDSATRRY